VSFLEWEKIQVDIQGPRDIQGLLQTDEVEGEPEAYEEIVIRLNVFASASRVPRQRLRGT
jgi:hypothetical protein